MSSGLITHHASRITVPMTPERWQQIRQILEEALDRAPRERAAFLDEACAGDSSLREEVESLIASHEEADGFMDSPPYSLIADLAEEVKYSLKAGEQISHYEILSKLGAGGMGEVYLARDTRLGRNVALKLLPRTYTTDEQRIRRFEREARAVSALNHPNILMIFEIRHEAGTNFIATEFVEGRALREALSDERMSMAEAMDVAVQIAAALLAAHRAGIVHRDIKPDNIMLRPDGYVKVLDFGLAKLTEKQTPADGAEHVLIKATTSPGIVMGTAGYMSPEQARGQEVDTRTDIFSLGVVLYEMVTGDAPFKGETASDMIASILRNEPPPLDQYIPDAPTRLQSIIDRALRKDREERYQTIEEMLDGLKSLKSELELSDSLKAINRKEREGRPVIASNDSLSSPSSKEIAATGRDRAAQSQSSAEYLIGEIRQHRLAAVIVLAAIILAIALIGYFRGGSRTIDSVAVLPFANSNSDTDAQYLSDGIADSLITRLSQISNLKVMSFNSVARYRGQQTDSQSVGRELNVKAVLVGQITQLGDELLIRAELIDARDNSRLWGHQYNRKLTDLLAVQEDISNEISERLVVRLTGEDRERLAKRPTEDTEAYRLYLKGRYYWNLRSEEGLKQGIHYFNQAIARDPGYGLAYAGLADCYGLLSNYSSTPPQESMPKARAAALRALEIDESLAEAHASLGLVKKEFEGDFAGAQRAFERAIELNRNYPTAYQWQAENLVLLGRLDEALTAMKRAAELDPFSLIIGGEVGWVLYHARRYDEALERLRKMIEMDPAFHRNRFFLSRAYEQKRMYAEAISETQKAISLSGGYALYKASLGHIYGMAGRQKEARKILDELNEQAKREYVSPFAIALVHTGMGDKDRAFEQMERAYKARDTILVNYLRDPQLDSLRSDPRLADLMARVGLQP